MLTLKKIKIEAVMKNPILKTWFAAIGVFSATAAIAGGPTGVAVDPEPTAALPVENPVQFSAGIGLKVGQLSFEQSDDGEEDDGISSVGLNGFVRMDWNAWSVFADVNSVRRDIGDEDFDDFVPEGATAFGLHAGRNFGNLYAGAFIGRNWFQGDDADQDNGYVSGRLYGLEAEYRFSAVGAVFAQLGDAEMIGEAGDTAFDGRYYRVGGSYSFGKFGVAVDYERGTSKEIFEDEGDEGDYRAYSIEGSYDFGNNLTATLGYQTADYRAYTEEDGSESTVSLGLAIAFGDRSDRHNLTTSYQPGLAAAWAETLD
jgi:hypothetical protein